MAGFRHALKLFSSKSNSPYLCTRRLLNYSALCYDGDNDPSSAFFSENVQNLLKSLTRVDYDKVFRQRRLGNDKLSDPEYKLMTDTELQKALQEADEKASELLQIPPAVKLRDTSVWVLSRDPALTGLESSRMVFTDITFGVKNSERLIVVREPDGTLQEAEWDLRQKVNQVYFPQSGKTIKIPKMFKGNYFESLLERNEYEYVLDRACLQFEPDDPEYQRITSLTYQHVNEHNKFELLRSTRHFGALTFFLVWNKNIDNLLLELIETFHIDEAKDLVSLYSLVHQVEFNGETDLDIVKDYVQTAANKKGALELAIQAYKDVMSQREKLQKGIEAAHGVRD